MISLFIGLLFLTFMLWLGFKMTGALLSALFWLCIGWPIALITFVFGLLCCCTIILIPVGIGCFKAGFKFLVPGL